MIVAIADLYAIDRTHGQRVAAGLAHHLPPRSSAQQIPAAPDGCALVVSYYLGAMDTARGEQPPVHPTPNPAVVDAGSVDHSEPNAALSENTKVRSDGAGRVSGGRNAAAYGGRS